MEKLYFSPANTKLKKLEKITHKKVYSLDLLAGYSCPFAKDCKSCVIETLEGRRIKDGPHMKWRCYAASNEVLFPKTYQKHQYNFSLISSLKSIKEIVDLISRSIPKDAEIIRYHSSGDFFSKEYFQAAIVVSNLFPKVRFYTYTKALPYWIQYKDRMPKNFILTASYGGTHDYLIEKHNLPFVKVIEKDETTSLPISTTDLEAAGYTKKKNFALYIHGIQPAKVTR